MGSGGFQLDLMYGTAPELAYLMRRGDIDGWGRWIDGCGLAELSVKSTRSPLEVHR